MSEAKKNRVGLIIVLVVLGIAVYLLLNYLVDMQKGRNLERKLQFGDEMYEKKLKEVERGQERGDYSYEEARDRINELSDERQREIEKSGDRYRK